MIYYLRCVGTRLISSQFRIFSIVGRASIHKTVQLNSGKIGNVNMERIIAIGQMCATNDKLANRQQVNQIVESAVQQEACVSIATVENRTTTSFTIAFDRFVRSVRSVRLFARML